MTLETLDPSDFPNIPEAKKVISIFEKDEISNEEAYFVIEQ